MRYGSVCSGIEAASQAWHGLGWRASFFSEIEKFPRAVLAERWPGVSIHGDFTTIKAGDYEPIDILVGGTPCQSFSLAGLRGGLADARGGLALAYLKLAQRLRPKWVVWENVPGVLSSGGGRDFGSFLGGLGELGYGWAYRVLDAQYFGVPQRRRRIFVVGCLGDWRRAAAVLFERESLRGDSPPRRGAGKAVAALTSSGVGTCGADDNQAAAGHLIFAIQERAVCENPDAGPDGAGFRADGLAYTLEARPVPQAVFGEPLAFNLRGRDGGAQVEVDRENLASLRAASGGASRSFVAFGGNNTSGPIDVAPALNAHPGGGRRMDFESEAFAVYPILEAGARTGASTDDERAGVGIGNPGDPMFTLQSCKQHAIAFDCKASAGFQAVSESGVVPTLRAMGHSASHQNAGGQIAVSGDFGVRRLTPRECERLQGFPDDYTRISWRGKPPEQCPDGPRYRALGNSMAVPVMRWIGQRIAMVESGGLGR